MNVILILLFFAIFSASDDIQADLRQYSLNRVHVSDAGFPVSFPQLYFFNAKEELFYVTGGGSGDAAGDIKTFAKGPDENKLQRMGRRSPTHDHARWAGRFVRLTEMLALPDDTLLSDAGSVTLIGFILDVHDYPYCHPRKTLKEKDAKAESKRKSIGSSCHTKTTRRESSQNISAC